MFRCNAEDHLPSAVSMRSPGRTTDGGQSHLHRRADRRGNAGGRRAAVLVWGELPSIESGSDNQALVSRKRPRYNLWRGSRLITGRPQGQQKGSSDRFDGRRGCPSL